MRRSEVATASGAVLRFGSQWVFWGAVRDWLRGFMQVRPEDPS